MKENLTFLQLKKASKSIDLENVDFTFVLMGDCATQHLAQAIRGYAVIEEIKLVQLFVINAL